MVQSSRPMRWKPEAWSRGKVALGGARISLNDETARLKRELARVNKELFLLEAATFFAKESP